MDKINTQLIYGFLDAGKTTYIQDTVTHDFFYKDGVTLILSFEEGEVEYDTTLLSKFRTYVAFYDSNESVREFCLHAIEKYHPNRVYIEMSTMTENLRENLPDVLNVVYSTTLFLWNTLPLYVENLKPYIVKMVRDSNQVIFRDCPSKEALSPYTTLFRSLNPKASYLRQDPMGYHEKAFDLFLPYSLEDKEIRIDEKTFIWLFLDSYDHPEHYDGKRIIFTDPLSVENHRVGRTVMTCCMADLQFMSFPLTDTTIPDGWIMLTSDASLSIDTFGQKHLSLSPVSYERIAPPKELLLNLRVSTNM